MKIEFKSKDENKDFDGPVIDIYFNTSQEAFELGVLFAKISSTNNIVWRCVSNLNSNGFIRLPLMSSKSDDKEEKTKDLKEDVNKEKLPKL